MTESLWLNSCLCVMSASPSRLGFQDSAERKFVSTILCIRLPSGIFGKQLKVSSSPPKPHTAAQVAEMRGVARGSRREADTCMLRQSHHAWVNYVSPSLAKSHCWIGSSLVPTTIAREDLTGVRQDNQTKYEAISGFDYPTSSIHSSATASWETDPIPSGDPRT